MIDSEFEVFIKLGGEVRYLDVIESRQKELMATESFQSIPEHSPERQLILDGTTLVTLAQDNAYLITLIAKTKQALDAGDIKTASFCLRCAFK